MNTMKSSALLKADAREQLLGKYKTVILAYIVMQIFVSGCLGLVESQLNLQNATGALIYYAVYFIITLLTAIFTVGQQYLYLNIAREKAYSFSDMWYGFKSCADRAILINLFIILKSFLYCIPFICSVILIVATKNYYLSLIAAVCFIFMMIGTLLVTIDYSQALFLIIDHPDKNARELMQESKQLMKGHRGSYFYLMVSFLGMCILGLLTLGIGMLWVYPYIYATRTNYYLELIKIQA